MTQRSELQHRIAELKAVLQTWVANRLLSFKQTGKDGFLKRRIMPQAQNSQTGRG